MIGTDIGKAVELLNAGQLVAIPTETVYGLSANALNEDAVVRIFQAKERPHFDPLIVHFRDRESIEPYVVHFPEKAEILASAFWPGPLTLILEKTDLIPDMVTSGLPHVAVRVPMHPVTLELLDKLDFPLAAPSANPFGYVSPTSAQHVKDQLSDVVDYILDGGASIVGLESTIVSFENDKPTILRFGGTPKEKIEAFIGPVAERTYSTSNPEAPGQLSRHYASHTPLIISGNIREAVEEHSGKMVGTISFLPIEIEGTINIPLSESGDMVKAAKRLFACIREADASGFDLIVAELVPDHGLGKAINDRLKRAAYH